MSRLYFSKNDSTGWLATKDPGTLSVWCYFSCCGDQFVLTFPSFLLIQVYGFASVFLINLNKQTNCLSLLLHNMLIVSCSCVVGAFFLVCVQIN
jgi:hypothetical protein